MTASALVFYGAHWIFYKQDTCFNDSQLAISSSEKQKLPKPKLPRALPLDPTGGALSVHPRPPSCIIASLTSFVMLQGHLTGRPQ